MKSKIEQILNKNELKVIKKLSNPQKIQDFLDKLPFNLEIGGETYMSPRRVLREKQAHCFEGALLAHLCLSYHGYFTRLIDLKVKKSAVDDSDHVVCLFKQNGYFGAISKTNHSVLRYRDPIYQTVRELIFSYFHEYFLDDGGKTLDSYSKPIDLFKGTDLNWIIREKELHALAFKIDHLPHLDFVPPKNKRLIRKVGKAEIKGAAVAEWVARGSKIRKML